MERLSSRVASFLAGFVCGKMGLCKVKNDVAGSSKVLLFFLSIDMEQLFYHSLFILMNDSFHPRIGRTGLIYKLSLDSPVFRGLKS